MHGYEPLWRDAERRAQELPRRIEALVASFPKSGKMMVRWALGAYLREAHGLIGPLGPNRMWRYAPDLRQAPERPEKERGPGGFAFLDRSDIPFVAFTHWPYAAEALADVPKVIVVRDPRAVMVSFYWWVTERERAWSGSFGDFIRTPEYGVHRLDVFLRSWSAVSRVTLVTYEAWQCDPGRELERLLRGVGIDPSGEHVERAVAASTFDTMRAAETAVHPERAGNDRHVRRGTVEGWRDELTPSQRRDLEWVLSAGLSDVSRAILADTGLEVRRRRRPHLTFRRFLPRLA